MAYNKDYTERYLDLIKDKPSFQYIDDISCQDLNLNLLFSKLNNTNSAIGEQYFYSCFRLLKKNDRLLEYTDKIPKRAEHNIANTLEKLSDPKDYDIINLIEDEIHLNALYYKYAQYALFALILIIVGGVFNPKMYIIIAPLFLLNFYFHYANKSYVTYYNAVIHGLGKSIRVADTLSKHKLFQTEFKQIDLRKLRRAVKYSGLNNALNKNEFLFPFWMLIELVRITFNIEIIRLHRKAKNLRTSKKEILKLFEFIGKVDVALALRKIKTEFDTCETQENQEKSISFKKLYHPLIQEAVKNDLSIQKESLIITGSNMSGKTTFLRTIGVNQIFAHNFSFCFADAYASPKLKIKTSITLNDDINDAKSYYLTEVLRMKEFLRMDESKSLILIDEIFKGTNAKERIAISKAILSYLNNDKCIVCVSTHDLGIAKYFEGKNFKLIYFDEDVENDKIHFSYQLKHGISKKTNAIKILEVNDYPEEVIQMANNLLN